MKWPGCTIRTPIGLDAGSRCVKAVQLERAGGRWRLRAAVVLPCAADPSQTADQLRQALYRHGFVGQDLVLAVPSAMLDLDVLELPPRSSGAPIEKLAEMELCRSARLEGERYEFGCWDLPAPPRASASSSVMAVALRHSRAAQLLDPLEHEGLAVTALEVQSWAVARACQFTDCAAGMTAVLDLGYSSAVMTLLRQGVVVYQRVLGEASLGMIQSAVSAEFQLGPEETDYLLNHVGLAESSSADLAQFMQAQRVARVLAKHVDQLVDEIQAAFQYASHRYPDTPLNHLFLVGGGSTIAGLPSFLSARLNVQARVLTPDELVDCPAHLAGLCRDGLLTPAIGLVLRGNVPSTAGVNLIPSDRLRLRQRRRRLRRWAAATAAWAMLVFSACVAAYLAGDGGYAAFADELTGTQRQLDQLNMKLTELKQRLDLAQTALQTVRDLSDQPDWSILLALLGESMGQRVVLREIQLQGEVPASPVSSGRSSANDTRSDQFRLHLRGLAISQTDASGFVLRLQDTGLFDEVRLMRTGREPVLSITAVSFEISCLMRHRSGGQP